MIKLIKRLYEKRLLAKENVNSVSIGHKFKDGKATSELCVFVTVTEKKPELALREEDIIPKKLLGLFSTDVYQVGELVEESAWKEKHRPVKIGASMAWEGLTACSAGLPVWDGKDQYVLMNGHCVSSYGRAKEGDAVLNPSPSDGGKAKDKVGEVTNINYLVDKDREDNIDLSLVKATEEFAQEDVDGRTYIPETRYINNDDIFKAIMGGGRTTGQTVQGMIISIDATAKVRTSNGDIIKYKDCVMCLNSDGDGTPIVRAGDSSSIRFVDDRPLLQTFAGSELVGIFNQTKKSIDWIKKEHGLKLSVNKPEEPLEGYIALGTWLNFNGLEIKTKDFPLRARLRSSIGLEDNIIKTLPGGTIVAIQECAGIKDGYYWFKVKVI